MSTRADLYNRNRIPTVVPINEHPRVLLVEDDQALAEELVEMLLAAGIPVISVHSASQAIHELEEQVHLEVVVTDIILSDFSGLELLRKLSKLGPARQLRAIVLSGHATVDHVLNALRLGVVDFLPKPVIAEELIDSIRRALAHQHPGKRLLRQEPTLSEAAQLLLSVRRKRDAIFGSDLFEDPAWNIMLDLYSSTLRGQKVVVTDLCVASGASATTALRRLQLLVELGLIERVPDPDDRRRVLVVQTDQGRAAMDQFAEWLRDNMAERKRA